MGLSGDRKKNYFRSTGKKIGETGEEKQKKGQTLEKKNA